MYFMISFYLSSLITWAGKAIYRFAEIQDDLLKND